MPISKDFHPPGKKKTIIYLSPPLFRSFFRLSACPVHPSTAQIPVCRTSQDERLEKVVTPRNDQNDVFFGPFRSGCLHAFLLVKIRSPEKAQVISLHKYAAPLSSLDNRPGLTYFLLFSLPFLPVILRNLLMNSSTKDPT